MVVERSEPAPAEPLYDAFICYRQQDPDRLSARKLHAARETFRPPKALPIRSHRAARVGWSEDPTEVEVEVKVEAACASRSALVSLARRHRSPRPPRDLRFTLGVAFEGGSYLNQFKPYGVPDADVWKLAELGHRVHGRPTDAERSRDLLDREQPFDSE